MEKAEFIKIKKKFLEEQLNGKKYDAKKGRLLRKDYVEKDDDNIKNIYIIKNEKKENEKSKKYQSLCIEEIKINSSDAKENRAIKIAICRAHEDMQVRTIGKYSTEDLEKSGLFDWGQEDSPMKYLFDEICNWLSRSSGKTYDKWYYEVTKEVIKKFNKLSKDKNIKIELGKVQKLINMSLKYLYCMADEGQEELFKECHMPLDHYTLENWFCRNIHEYEGEPFDKKQLKAWSNISDYGLYIKVQQAIRAYIEKSEYKIDGNPMTPLQAEFIIWEEEKIREALLGVINLEVNEKNQCYADLQAIKNKASEVVKKLNDEE